MAKRRRKTHLIRSCDAPLLMARILGSAGSTVTRLSISGRGGQQFVAKNVAKDQQCLNAWGRSGTPCCAAPARPQVAAEIGEHVHQFVTLKRLRGRAPVTRRSVRTCAPASGGRD